MGGVLSAAQLATHIWWLHNHWDTQVGQACWEHCISFPHPSNAFSFSHFCQSLLFVQDASYSSPQMETQVKMAGAVAQATMAAAQAADAAASAAQACGIRIRKAVVSQKWASIIAANAWHSQMDDLNWQCVLLVTWFFGYIAFSPSHSTSFGRNTSQQNWACYYRCWTTSSSHLSTISWRLKLAYRHWPDWGLWSQVPRLYWPYKQAVMKTTYLVSHKQIMFTHTKFQWWHLKLLLTNVVLLIKSVSIVSGSAKPYKIFPRMQLNKTLALYLLLN